jgi:hypothetical protein
VGSGSHKQEVVVLVRPTKDCEGEPAGRVAEWSFRCTRGADGDCTTTDGQYQDAKGGDLFQYAIDGLKQEFKPVFAK